NRPQWYAHAVFVAGARVVFCLAVTTGTADAVADEPFQAQLRLLQHNVRTFSDHNCEARSRAFGHIVASAQPEYDIVGLEEYYRNSPFGVGICEPTSLLYNA